MKVHDVSLLFNEINFLAAWPIHKSTVRSNKFTHVEANKSIYLLFSK